ncbi:MAG: hypothetical protein QG578_1442 [Thermodesulfobacteriota bacterium]|nr:hypothetical protein [Thermodesulfobacteriota bacterium]
MNLNPGFCKNVRAPRILVQRACIPSHISDYPRQQLFLYQEEG